MIIQPMHTSTSTSPALTTATPSSLSALSGVVELTHLGVIRVAGVDSVKFLQGQLTQDVSLMSLTEARLAAYCNAKGRMQASFVLFKRSEDEILMVCSRDILAQTLKRLSMFVLRDKVKLLDASADYSLFGLTGDAIKSIAGGAHVYWAKHDFNTESTVFLYPGAGEARALWCAPSGTPAPVGPRLEAGLWEWLEVQSGVAMITQPIFEAFVPQMLNYESVGGVNFQKGSTPDKRWWRAASFAARSSDGPSWRIARQSPVWDKKFFTHSMRSSLVAWLQLVRPIPRADLTRWCRCRPLQQPMLVTPGSRWGALRARL